MDTSSQTGTTLFAILAQPGSGEAWDRFVERYGPKVFRWCRQRGLQTADAEDIAQEVLTRFAKTARTFSYDETKTGFRAWLRTVTKHALSDAISDLRRRRETLNALPILESAEELDRVLAEEFDRELLEQAMNFVRTRVAPTTWRAFELLTVAGKAGKDVAAELNVSVAAAYMAKSRVSQMLAERIRQLEART